VANHKALVLSILLAGAFGETGAAEEPAAMASGVTEEQAVREALEQSPAIALGRSELEQARARLITARTYPANPEIGLEAARRESDAASSTDRGISLSQEVSISGVRGARVDQASAELESAAARLLHESRLVVARVRAAFTQALRARESVAIEAANTELVEMLAASARKGMELGAGTQIETNVALSQLGRARRARHQAEAEYAVARAVLREAIGSGPPEGPLPRGNLVLGQIPSVDVANLLTEARNRRADLLAFRSAIRAAEARTRVAHREAVPSLTFGGFREREGIDTVTGASLTMAIPVFNRNQGAIREAAAQQLTAEAELRLGEAEVDRAGVESLARLLAAHRAASELGSDVVGNLQDSLRLLLRSFEAGKIGFPEVLAFRRELVDAQREYLETLAGTRLARIELDLITGNDPLSPEPQDIDNGGKP
jgi:cobalt-zinc-cadmium efflux system outer membrane protein